MSQENNVSNRISADLQQSWHIPRPTLARSSESSQELTSSNNSTKSAKSGYLLLNAVNLAKVHLQEQKTFNRSNNLQYYLQQTNNKEFLSIPIDPKKYQDNDNLSVASSTHFTVVNVNAKPQRRSRGFCRKHQLSILVTSMSILFTLGVLVAILCLEMRAQKGKS